MPVFNLLMPLFQFFRNVNPVNRKCQYGFLQVTRLRLVTWKNPYQHFLFIGLVHSLTISLSCPQCNVLQRAAISSGPYNILLKPMIHELIRTDGKKRWQDSNDTIQLSVLRVSDFFLHSSFLSGFLLQIHIYVMNQRYLQYSKLLLANGQLEVTVIL